MGREIPWNWFRPGPEREAARARDKRRREKERRGKKVATKSRAKVESRLLSLADRNAEIRRLWGKGWLGIELAERFALARSTVSGIVAGMPSRRRYGNPWEVAWPYPRRRTPGLPDATRRPREFEKSERSDPADVLGSRANAPRGSAHGRAKLDEAKVARMKRLRLEGWTTGMLAREFGVGRNMVCYIVNGVNWTHVEPAPPANGGTA